MTQAPKTLASKTLATDDQLLAFQDAIMTSTYDLADQMGFDYSTAVTIVMDACLVEIHPAGDDLCRSYIEASLDLLVAAPDSQAEATAATARNTLGPQLLDALRAADEREFQTTVYQGGGPVQ